MKYGVASITNIASDAANVSCSSRRASQYTSSTVPSAHSAEGSLATKSAIPNTDRNTACVQTNSGGCSSAGPPGSRRKPIARVYDSLRFERIHRVVVSGQVPQANLAEEQNGRREAEQQKAQRRLRSERPVISPCFGKMGTGSNFRHPRLLQSVTSGGRKFVPVPDFSHKQSFIAAYQRPVGYRFKFQLWPAAYPI